MKDQKYKLDRSKLRSMTFEEADDHVTFWNDKTESERLDAACFIINQIFDVGPSDKVNYELSDKRKNNNG